ncbi:reverse transcriptase domain-containing protein [Pseudomonas sp. 910_21]|uniref:reverse transcriptase domain-containing protein n=1 Tax=Pseudomonas sp. 910_21 TaxID=2604460 RepID=UPI00406499D7
MSKLKECRSAQDLACALDTNYKKIAYFYYELDRSKKSYYESFEVPKKNGGARTIKAPKSQLKNLQKKLSVLLQEIFVPHSCAHGFVEKKSIVTNARNHTRKKYVFNIDLNDFFETITFPRVYGLLISKPYSLSGDVASVIAHLCTVDGCLPQGAPTSPVLSNMICRSLDRQLRKLARLSRADYSRYADDITFSFYAPKDYVNDSIVSFRVDAGNYFSNAGDVLSRIIGKNKFSINESKTRLQDRFECQLVTGLVVNKKINVPRAFVRKTCAMIHSIESFGLASAQARFIKENPESKAKIENVVFGRILHMKNVVGFESVVYKRVALRFNQLSIGRKAPLSSRENGVISAKFCSWVNRRCWVIENNEEISQGSGFMISDNLLVTCAHVIGSAKTVEVFRAGENIKYEAIVCHISPDSHVDVAILKVKDAPEAFEEFHYKDEAVSLSLGQVLTILGFPKYKHDAKSVWINKALLVNQVRVSSSLYGYIDKELYAGNSGGAVLDEGGSLIGMVIKGNNDAESVDDIYVDHSAFLSFSDVLTCVKALKQKYAA